MNGLSAVIFLPDDCAKTGYPQPTMLSPLLGVPLLTWLSHALYEGGFGRFFLVGHEPFLSRAKACIPPEAELMTSADSNPADQLHVFLSTADDADEDVTIIAGPTLFLPMIREPRGPAVLSYLAERESLMDALDNEFSFSRFLHENGTVLNDAQGFYSVESPALFPEFGRLLRMDQVLRLTRQGVEIYDPDSCYIDPTVRLEKGAKLLPGTILRGNTLIRAGAVIGPWSVLENSEVGEGSTVNASQVYSSVIGQEVSVGPYAHIRPGSELGRSVHVGSFVETKNAKLGENTWAAHLSYLGDAEIGSHCNIGCGTSTANYDRAEKHKTTVGDHAFIGCNTVLVAPVNVGSGAYVGAGSTITEDIPENALGIARSRQSNKKDWSSKHKQPSIL
ncbi:MAG: hypothetical protein IKM59_06020 [Oscillospiraceae bacterium]|nr:hypothetical protein [Oscillospiraceae bacterium]